MSLSNPKQRFDVTIKDEHKKNQFYVEWEQWHQKHLTWLADPFGYLSIIDLHWLSNEPLRFDSLPGEWWVNNDKINVKLRNGESITFQNEVITEEFEFKKLQDRDSLFVDLNNAKIEVAKRGGNNLLRLRSPESDILKNFTGVPAFYPDEKWRVDAVYLKHDFAVPTTVGAVFEDLYHTYDATGIIKFNIESNEYSLITFDYGDQLLVIFKDETSGKETYGAQRAIYLPRLKDKEVFKLDFNRAVNIMCAYSNLCPCPLPPRENILNIKISAGEKKPA